MNDVVESASPGREGPGSQLRAKRQERGLDLAEVAAQLHLTSRVVQQLERDDYEGMGHVFAIGYLRNYARLLRLDPEPYVELYRAKVQNFPTPVPKKTARTEKRPKRRFPLLPFLGLLLILLIGGIALWYAWPILFPSQEEKPLLDAAGESLPAEPVSPLPMESQESTHSEAVASIAPPPAPEPEPASEPEPQAPALQPSSVPSEAAPEIPPTLPAEPQQGMAAEPPSAPPTPAQPEQPPATEVVLRFSGPCWVDIRDSSRKFKLFGEMKAGDQQVLAGTPPYSILLGNAAAVEVTIGGKPFDLSKKTRGNVAKFTLDPTQ